jgi:hypothetical protein
MSDERYAKEFFFAELPDQEVLSRLPATGRDVIVARVRIIESIAYVGGRHNGARPPSRFVAAKVVLAARIGSLRPPRGPQRLAIELTFISGLAER